MKTNQIISEGVVGVSIEVSVPEMIAISNVKETIDKLLSDNLFKGTESGLPEARSKYRSSTIYVKTELAEMISVFLSKMSKDVPSIDAATKAVFTVEE
jgi:hypothetical protein